MLVRPSKHVDLSGRCAIQYTLDWNRKPEVRLHSPLSISLSLSLYFKPCHIAALLQAMQDHFSRFPPLYAKPKSSSPLPSLSSSSASDRPPLPPKPIESHTPPVPPRPTDTPPTPPLQVCPSVSIPLHLPQSYFLSRQTCTIVPRRLCLVLIPNPLNITNQFSLRRPPLLPSEISCDQPSNSLEILPLPSVLITAPQYFRRPCPIQSYKVRRRMFIPRLSLSPPTSFLSLNHIFSLHLQICSMTNPLPHSPLLLPHRHALPTQNCSNYMLKFTTRFDQSFPP